MKNSNSNINNSNSNIILDWSLRLWFSLNRINYTVQNAMCKWMQRAQIITTKIQHVHTKSDRESCMIKINMENNDKNNVWSDFLNRWRCSLFARRFLSHRITKNSHLCLPRTWRQNDITRNTHKYECNFTITARTTNKNLNQPKIYEGKKQSNIHEPYRWYYYLCYWFILTHKMYTHTWISLVEARFTCLINQKFVVHDRKNQEKKSHYNIYETILMKLIWYAGDLCTEFNDLLDDKRRWIWQHARASIISSNFNLFLLHFCHVYVIVFKIKSIWTKHGLSQFEKQKGMMSDDIYTHTNWKTHDYITQE